MQWNPFAVLFVLNIVISLTSKVACWKTIKFTPECTGLFQKARIEGGNDLFPLVVWLGDPSLAIHTEKKHGAVPFFSAWSQFVDVMYIPQCRCCGDRSAELAELLVSWITRNKQTHESRLSLYLGGSGQDSLMGGQLLGLIESLLNRGLTIAVDVAGVFLVNFEHAPALQVVAHRSFETGNGLSFWSIDRAQQPVFCNVHAGQVQLLMNDVLFHYLPSLAVHPLSSANATGGASTAHSRSCFNGSGCGDSGDNVNSSRDRSAASGYAGGSGHWARSRETVRFQLVGAAATDECFDSSHAFAARWAERVAAMEGVAVVNSAAALPRGI